MAANVQKHRACKVAWSEEKDGATDWESPLDANTASKLDSEKRKAKEEEVEEGEEEEEEEAYRL